MGENGDAEPEGNEENPVKNLSEIANLCKILELNVEIVVKRY